MHVKRYTIGNFSQLKSENSSAEKEGWMQTQDMGKPLFAPS